MSDASKAQHEALLQKILQATAWPDDTLQGHLEAWNRDRDALLEGLPPERVAVIGGDLVWTSFPAGQELGRVRLFDEPKSARVGSRALTLISPRDGRQLGTLPIPADCRPGLLIDEDRVLIHAPELEMAPTLAETTWFVDAAAQDFRTQHVDLHVHLPNQLLFACCRELGEVVVCSLDGREELTRWQIRPKGSYHCLNIAFDVDDERCYLTDNTSGQLWIADLETLEFKVWKSGLGILGNLAPGKEPGKIFLTKLAPEFSMVYFDIDTMTASYSLDIKGNSYAQARMLPFDPFQVSPRHAQLQFQTWTELEGRKSPVVNLIDPVEIICQKRYSLKDNLPNIGLAFPSPSPFPAWHALDFKTWLIKNKLLTESQLTQVAPPKAAPAVVKRQPVARKDFRIYQPPAEDADLWKRIGQDAEHLELPVAAEEAIIDLLNWAFYRVTLTNLRIHTDEMKRLKPLAHGIRLELASKDVVLAKIDGVLGRHSFETPISRKAVFELIQQGNLKGEMVRLEDTCPMCQTPFENKVCPACAFSLTREPDFEPKSVSAEPATSLYPGQLLIPHRALNSLLTLNIWRQPLQRLELQAAGVLQLGSGIVLPNHNYLVSDLKGNKVLEVSPSGEVLWKAKLALKQPVQVGYCYGDGGVHYLIVDQGNARVLEQDATGKSFRRYPMMKTPDADKLKAPRDVQLTPTGTWLISDPGIQAVLEVDARGQALRRYDADLGVSAPLLARRQPDGSTDIIDSAQKACLSYSAEGELLKRFVYWPPPPDGTHDNWAAKAAPDWGCQLHNGEYLLMGEDYIMMIAPKTDMLRWIVPIPDPVKEDSLLKVGFKSRSSGEQKKLSLENIVTELKSIGMLEGEKDEHLLSLADKLQTVRGNPGDWLVKPGEVGNGVYFLLEGKVEVIAHEDEKPVITTLEPGDICGQQAVFAGADDKAYKPGLKVSESARLLMLERGEFKKAVLGFPRLYQLIRTLDNDTQRRYRLFAERKTEALQGVLRKSINETRIREFGLFAGADDKFFDVLSERVHPMAYLPEQEVFGRLESAGSLYLILEGTVGVLRKGESEPMIVLAEGDIFGEMALYLDQPRSATVRTLDYCKFFEIEYRHIRALGKQFPWFGERLEDMARSRASSNQVAISAFEEAAGLKRQDLPVLEVNPPGQRQGQKVFYHASLRHDALIGFNTLGELLWYYGRESGSQLFHPSRINDLGSTLLVCDQDNDRVLEIDVYTREITRKWSGSLSRPAAAAFTPEGLLLVADPGNQRLVVMDETGREVWTHGLPEEIMNPTWAEFTPEGNILFADAGMHRVYELNRDGTLVWKHGKWRNPGATADQLDSPSCARRLTDGSTLIADAGNRRLVWVRPESEPLMLPLEAYNFDPEYVELLETGEILVVSSSQDRLIKLNRRGEITWKAEISFPHAAESQSADSTAVKVQDPGERWILDFDRIDELAPDTPVVPEEAVAEAGDSAAELVLAWGEDTSEPDYQPEPLPESNQDLAFDNVLDNALDDLHQDLHQDHRASQASTLSQGLTQEDLVEAMPWADLNLLDEALASDDTLHFSALKPKSDADADFELDLDELDALFNDASPEMHYEPAAEPALAPVPEQAPQDLGAALDQLFDDDNFGPFAPVADAPPLSANETNTKLMPGLASSTQMLPSSTSMPTRMMPTQSANTIPFEKIPWAELGFEEDDTPPSSPPADHNPYTQDAPEDLASALDMFFDDLEPSTPFAPAQAHPLPSEPGQATEYYHPHQNSQSTEVVGAPAQMTRMVPNHYMPTRVMPSMGTIPLQDSPWAEIGQTSGTQPAPAEHQAQAPVPPRAGTSELPQMPSGSGWSDEDFDFLDQLE